MSPISLVILNPTGIVLMEIHKQRSSTKSLSMLKIILTAFKRMVTGPIVFMTFIGLAGHFILDGMLPEVIDRILSALGQAFLATALFYLGVNMVGNMKTKVGSGLAVPLLLISAKSLFLPLIAREMVQVLNAGSRTNDTDSWSLFGFLYGTFPAAPSSAILAAKYGLEEQLVTSTVVLSTFLSAPLMFIFAQMALVDCISSDASGNILKDAMIDISGTAIPFSLVACVSTLLSQIWTESMFLLSFISIFFFVGVWGSRCSTAMVAFALCLVRCRGDDTVKKFRVWIWLFGFGLPIVFSAVITGVLLYEMPKDQLTPLFLYAMITAPPAMIASVLLLFVCITVTVVSLIYLQRHDRYCKCSQRLKTQCGQLQQDENVTQEIQRCNRCLEKDPLAVENVIPACSEDITTDELSESTCLLTKGNQSKEGPYTDDERIEVEAIFGGKSVEMDLSVDEYLKGEKHQLERHVTMLLILVVMMVIGLFLGLWRLLNEDTSSGVFVALRIADTFGLLGQILVIFACFGFEKQLIVIPFLSRWRKFWYGVEEISLRRVEDLDPGVNPRCEQFDRYHKQRCEQSIVSDQ